jgi:hypothetical protein
MHRTPKEIADRLVQMYGTSTKGMPIHKKEFEKQAERQGVDYRLVRSKVSKNAIFGPNLLPVIWTS